MGVGKVITGPKIQYKFDERTIGQFFYEQAEKFHDKICQIDAISGKTETFGSVIERSTKVAVELKKRGVTSNDYVIVCSSNTLDSAIPYVGAALLGAKVGALDPSQSTRDVKHLFSLVKPKAVFVEESAVELIEQSICGIAAEIVVFGKSSKHSTFAEFQQSSEIDFKPGAADVKETAIIFFSSGTTGLPKVICVSHFGAINNSLLPLEINLKIDSLLHFTTLYWLSAVFMLFLSFGIGAYRVLCLQFTPESTYKIIETHKVSYIFSAPSVVYALADFEEADKYDTSSVQSFVTGGAKVSVPKLQKAQQIFNTSLSVGYGMSECGWVCGFYPGLHDKEIRAKPESCGKAAPGMSIKVVDPESRKLLAANEKGEIMIKTPLLMKGYLNADTTQLFDQEGFLKTGDIGYYDDDDCFYIVDRIKEMFKYKSWHIVPASIEMVLLQHPEVKEAVVFGLPDDIDGELPAAWVVLTEESKLSAKDVEQFVYERVLDRERLRGGVTIVTSLPKTPSGKVLRKKVRDAVIDNNLSQVQKQ